MRIDTLIQRINQTQCPVVVGLDPLIERLPAHLIASAHKEFGPGPSANLQAIWNFNEELLQAIAPLIPAVKLQKACYELYGAPGIEVFEKTAQLAAQLGLIVIDDSKRGDIGSTALHYAQGLLGGAPAEVTAPASHFVTVNPYLGWDGIDPFLEVGQKLDKGIFLLVRTSNPSASQYQEAQIAGLPLYQKIAQDLEARSQTQVGAQGFSNLGAVVGATWPQEAALLRQLMPSVYFLVPGYGAQGGTGLDVAHSFNAQGYGALINSSRGIIFAYENQTPPQEFAKASQAAVLAMREDLLQGLKAQGKLPRNW